MRNMPHLYHELYESPFTWRLINKVVNHPHQYHQTRSNKIEKSKNHMLLSTIQLKDFLEIREWLYDTENVRDDWTMHGIYHVHVADDAPASSLILDGVSFCFENIINAVHFRLRWDARRLD